MSFEIDFKKVEENWINPSIKKRTNKFYKKYDEYVKKLIEFMKNIETYNPTHYTVIKNKLYFLNNNTVVGSADASFIGVFEDNKTHTAYAQNGQKVELFSGKFTLDLDEFDFFKKITNKYILTVNRAKVYAAPFFFYLATYLGADRAFPIYPDMENNPVYLLYNLKFQPEMEVDTFLLQHYGYYLSKKACNFCKKEDSSISMKKCSVCYTVFYCSEECQRNHWSFHKDYCREKHELNEACEMCVFKQKHPENKTKMMLG